MTKRAIILPLVICATVLLADHFACGDSLRMVVERGMIAPGSGREFLSFGQLDGVGPAISGENVAFGGFISGGGGYYASIDGTIVVIADTEMVMPGSEETFGFSLGAGSDPSMSGRRVGFFARSSLGSSLWVWSEGELEMIAGTNITTVPGTNALFRSLGTLGGASPSISGENAAFTANSVQENIIVEGIYAYINGELRVIADANTTVPGEDVTFVTFGLTFGVSPSISGENVAFSAQWPQGDGSYWWGIWLYTNGSLQRIVRFGDPKPGGGGFATFGFLDGLGPSISGENVAFQDGAGIYARIKGEMRLIANTDSEPGASAQQIGPFKPPSISGENVVFTAAGPSGVYAYIDGSLQRVVDTSTEIPGHDVTFLGNLAGMPSSISGTNIAFAAGGIGTNGVYLLTKDPPVVPGQSDWSVIGVTLVLLAAASAIILRRLLSPAR